MQVRFVETSGGVCGNQPIMPLKAGHPVVFIPDSFKPVKISPRHNRRTSEPSDMWLLGIPWFHRLKQKI